MAKAPSSQSNPTSSFNREKRGGFLLYTPEVGKKLAKLAKSGNDPVLTQLEKLANHNPQKSPALGEQQAGPLYYLSGGGEKKSNGVLYIHPQDKKMPLTVIDIIPYGDMVGLREIRPKVLASLAASANQLMSTYETAPANKKPSLNVYRPRKGLQPSV